MNICLNTNISYLPYLPMAWWSHLWVSHDNDLHKLKSDTISICFQHMFFKLNTTIHITKKYVIDYINLK